MNRPLSFGTEGVVVPGVRRGLPSHIDGVPVRDTVSVLTLPRRYSRFGAPLPMFELREDGDGGNGVAASWPEPFPSHDLAAGEVTTSA